MLLDITFHCTIHTLVVHKQMKLTCTKSDLTMLVILKQLRNIMAYSHVIQ